MTHKKTVLGFGLSVCADGLLTGDCLISRYCILDVTKLSGRTGVRHAPSQT